VFFVAGYLQQKRETKSRKEAKIKTRREKEIKKVSCFALTSFAGQVGQ
jgi:hypothetical protein